MICEILTHRIGTRRNTEIRIKTEHSPANRDLIEWFLQFWSPYGGGYIRETLDDEFSLKEICTWFYVNEVIRNQKPTCHYLFPRLPHRLCFVTLIFFLKITLLTYVAFTYNYYSYHSWLNKDNIVNITENLRFESTMLKFKVKIEKWFSLASSGAMPSIFLRIQLTASWLAGQWNMCWISSGTCLEYEQLSSVSIFNLFFLTLVKSKLWRVKKNALCGWGKDRAG